MKLGGKAISGLFASGLWRAYRGDTPMQMAEVEALIGPNSIDVTLHPCILIPSMSSGAIPVDPRNASTLQWNEVLATNDEPILLHPGAFCLGAVNERFVCDALTTYGLFAPMYEGRSSCGRLGLASHITAGFGDHGFGGAFTLELYNHFPRPIVLYPGMRIGQVAFEQVVEPKVYTGAYSGNNHHNGPVPPKLGPDRF